VLFLYRPRQTWMPFSNPRNLMAQQDYNRELQERFDATRRVAPSEMTAEVDPIAALKELDALHRAGSLSDAEFAAAKAKVLGTGDPAS
jgi:hypothetical protein